MSDSDQTDINLDKAIELALFWVLPTLAVATTCMVLDKNG